MSLAKISEYTRPREQVPRVLFDLTTFCVLGGVVKRLVFGFVSLSTIAVAFAACSSPSNNGTTAGGASGTNPCFLATGSYVFLYTEVDDIQTCELGGPLEETWPKSSTDGKAWACTAPTPSLDDAGDIECATTCTLEGANTLVYSYKVAQNGFSGTVASTTNATVDGGATFCESSFVATDADTGS